MSCRTVLKTINIDQDGTTLVKIEYKTHRDLKNESETFTSVFTVVFSNDTTLTLTGVQDRRCCEKFTSHMVCTSDPTKICSAENAGHIASIGFEKIVITHTLEEEHDFKIKGITAVAIECVKNNTAEESDNAIIVSLKTCNMADATFPYYGKESIYVGFRNQHSGYYPHNVYAELISSAGESVFEFKTSV